VNAVQKSLHNSRRASPPIRIDKNNPVSCLYPLLIAKRRLIETELAGQLFLGHHRVESIGIEVDELDTYGDAAAFKGIARLPVRVKCAALAWRAALAQLDAIESKGNKAAAS